MSLSMFEDRSLEVTLDSFVKNKCKPLGDPGHFVIGLFFWMFYNQIDRLVLHFFP